MKPRLDGNFGLGRGGDPAMLPLLVFFVLAIIGGLFFL